MILTLLNTLICPFSRTELELIVFETKQIKNSEYIDTGLLISKDDKYFYPVINSIPRMLPDSLLIFNEILAPHLHRLNETQLKKYNEYFEKSLKLDKNFRHTQKSFSSEWSDLKNGDRAWGRSPEERLNEFVQRLDVNLDRIQNKKILDAGCGHGEIEIALAGQKVELFAVDLSFSVDDIHRRISISETNAIIHLVQANIHYLPFKDDCFDYIFSDGVLHHTPDTKKGFEIISKTLKPGGRSFIMVYSYDHKNKLDILIDRFIKLNKWFFNNLPHRILYIICYSLSPFYWGYLRTYKFFKHGSRRTNRSLKELGLSLFDAFSPKYDWNHSTDEVISWYDEFGYSNMKKTFFNHIGIGISGDRKKK